MGKKEKIPRRFRRVGIVRDGQEWGLVWQEWKSGGGGGGVYSNRVLRHSEQPRVAALLVHPADVLEEVEGALVGGDELEARDPELGRRSVDEELTARPKHAVRLVEPFARPLEVFGDNIPRRSQDANVVGRVGDDEVDRIGVEAGHALDATAELDIWYERRQ